ncbi:unnamed protein product [Blepharisma stoltei]|uniref:Dickkopf N-terminal cysteine-rich domain-containing protein n=1 Tax=Blepharisma stoltei TaxID=1481888 RepID=A0AAU9ISU6_9CILI|nr:unnamed protein product [Blepharisma stoltei]
MFISLLLFTAFLADGLRDENCEKIECADKKSENNVCFEAEVSSSCEGKNSCNDTSFFIYKPPKDMSCTWENFHTNEYLSGERAKPVQNIKFEYYHQDSRCECNPSDETVGCIKEANKTYCSAGYYCKNSESKELCIQASPYLGCKDDSQCPIGYGCNEKTCVELFSIGIGGSVSDPKFCRSIWVQNGVCDSVSVYTYSGTDKPGTKFSPIKNERKIFPDYDCDIGHWCIYSYSSKLEIFDIQKCRCGSASYKTNKGYCSHYATASFKHIEDIVSNNLRYKVSNCTGPYAHSGDLETLYRCGSIDSEKYENFTKEWNQLKFFSVFWGFKEIGYDSTHCPKEFGGSAYFTAFSVLFLLIV